MSKQVKSVQIANLEIHPHALIFSVNGVYVEVIQPTQHYRQFPELGPISQQYGLNVETKDSYSVVWKKPGYSARFFYSAELPMITKSPDLMQLIWDYRDRIIEVCGQVPHSDYLHGPDCHPILRPARKRQQHALRQWDSKRVRSLRDDLCELLAELEWTSELGARAEKANAEHAAKKVPEHRALHEDARKEEAENRARQLKANAKARKEGYTHSWKAVAHVDSNDRVYCGHVKVGADFPESKALESVKRLVTSKCNQARLEVARVDARLFPL